jgi:hypothetical protein
LVIQISTEGIETLGPEFLISGQPHGGLLQGFGRKLAFDDPAFLRSRDQSGGFENAKVLHESRQRHPVWLRQLGDARPAGAQRREHLASGTVGQRGEDEIQLGIQVAGQMSLPGCFRPCF